MPTHKSHEQQAKEPAVQQPNRDDVHEQREANQPVPGIVNEGNGSENKSNVGGRNHGSKRP